MEHRSIRVAIAGVGSCASSLVQAVHAAKAGALDASAPGLIYASLGGYRLEDIEFVAAFEVNSKKVGIDLGEAIFVEPNCATRYVETPLTGVDVVAGPLLDGLDGPLGRLVEPAAAVHTADVEGVAGILRDSRTDVLVCYLPTGSRNAVRTYAWAAALAGVAYVNGTPESVATDLEFQGLFEDSGAPLLGDDVKSQLGATALHTSLIDLCRSRAASVDTTYQLNIGGNSDFFNLADSARAASKRLTKRSALEAAGIEASGVNAGPSGYVAHLQDQKVAYIRLEGRLLLGMRYSMEVRLQVEDSPNAAGVIVNAVRAAAVAADRGEAGVVWAVCPFLFKNPPRTATEPQGRERFSSYLEGRPPGA